jgi:hypothetical protein
MAQPAVPSDAPALQLPSAGPDPLPLDTALAAIRGYACGRRPLRFRSPGTPQGRWVEVPAFGWTRFDAGPVGAAGELGILVAEGLHGRLDRDAWTTVHDTLARTSRLVNDAADRAQGRAFWELGDEELSVLGEPGTVGAILREIARQSGAHGAHVLAAHHHRCPRLVPHLTVSTRRALAPHTEEGDSGVEAVVRRELRANATAFGLLEEAVAAAPGDARPTRLRLHDILLWLRTTLRFAHAVELGRDRAHAT